MICRPALGDTSSSPPATSTRWSTARYSWTDSSTPALSPAVCCGALETPGGPRFPCPAGRRDFRRSGDGSQARRARDEQIVFAKRFEPLEFEITVLSDVKTDGTLASGADIDDDVMKLAQPQRRRPGKRRRLMREAARTLIRNDVAERMSRNPGRKAWAATSNGFMRARQSRKLVLRTSSFARPRFPKRKPGKCWSVRRLFRWIRQAGPGCRARRIALNSILVR